MTEANFADVQAELDALEAELEPIRVAVDEGEETFNAAPTARQAAMRHLELAMRHTTESAWALVEQAEWEEPEDHQDAIQILAEEDVIPGQLAVSLMALADFASEHGEETGWEPDPDTEGLFERLTEAADSLAEYVEYLHHFLKEWEG